MTTINLQDYPSHRTSEALLNKIGAHQIANAGTIRVELSAHGVLYLVVDGVNLMQLTGREITVSCVNLFRETT